MTPKSLLAKVLKRLEDGDLRGLRLDLATLGNDQKEALVTECRDVIELEIEHVGQYPSPCGRTFLTTGTPLEIYLSCHAGCQACAAEAKRSLRYVMDKIGGQEMPDFLSGNVLAQREARDRLALEEKKATDLLAAEMRREREARFERGHRALVPHSEGERRGGPRKERRGRKPVAPKDDEKILERWETKNFRTHADLARDLGKGVVEVKKALDRARKQQQRKRPSDK